MACHPAGEATRSQGACSEERLPTDGSLTPNGKTLINDNHHQSITALWLLMKRKAHFQTHVYV
jgi:hypothetical protein